MTNQWQVLGGGKRGKREEGRGGRGINQVKLKITINNNIDIPDRLTSDTLHWENPQQVQLVCVHCSPTEHDAEMCTNRKFSGLLPTAPETEAKNRRNVC